MNDPIVPTVVDADLSDYYFVQDELPSPHYRIEIREIVLNSLSGLSKFRRKIILLLMCGYEPKIVASYFKTNEMAITRAKREFLAQLHENGYEW